MKSSWFTETEVFLLHEIVARLDRLARKRVLDAAGLSYAEFVLATAVKELELPTQVEVGDFLDASKSLVSQRVAGLMAKGFLVQRREADDRRQVRLELTESGRRTLETIYERLAGNAEELLDVLGAERPQFLQALRRLRDAIVALEERVGNRKPPSLR